MKRNTAILLAILFGAAQFTFGLISLIQTGHDFRLFWMAVASALGAAIVTAIAKTRRQQPTSLFALSAGTFGLSALLAAATGFMLGARAGPGTLMVAIVLAACWAASCGFYLQTAQ